MTLGIELAMDGNQEGEKAYLREKAEDFNDRLRTAPGLSKNAAWEAVKTQIIATFKYPAAAIQLTEADWDYICRPVLTAGLPKSGIAKNFPRQAVWGPQLFQGLGLMHPFHFQELTHLEVILKHCSQDTFIGKMIQQSWEALRLELGLSGHLTDWDYETWGPLATNCWLKNVWKYCDEHGVQMEDAFPHLSTSRTNDVFLMEAFFNNPEVPNSDLKTLNECRTFF